MGTCTSTPRYWLESFAWMDGLLTWWIEFWHHLSIISEKGITSEIRCVPLTRVDDLRINSLNKLSFWVKLFICLHQRIRQAPPHVPGLRCLIPVERCVAGRRTSNLVWVTWVTWVTCEYVYFNVLWRLWCIEDPRVKENFLRWSDVPWCVAESLWHRLLGVTQGWERTGTSTPWTCC